MWLGLTDRPDMTLDVYRGRKTTIQYNQLVIFNDILHMSFLAGTHVLKAFLALFGFSRIILIITDSVFHSWLSQAYLVCGFHSIEIK